MGLNTIWRKYSDAGSCVEVRTINGQVQVRDSNNRSGPVLTFSPKAWQDLLASVKAGEFDQ